MLRHLRAATLSASLLTAVLAKAQTSVPVNTLRGYVEEMGSGERLLGATVYDLNRRARRHYQ